MPCLEIDGLTVAYEVAGSGPAVVFTGGARNARDDFGYAVSGRLSGEYTTLLWDRPNSGMSGIRIDDSPSELHIHTDVLHVLLAELGLSPAHFVGGSAGCVMSLLHAHRYPDDVKSLLLHTPPTDDAQLITPFVEGYLTILADAADHGGMENVIRVSRSPPDPELAWMTTWIADQAQQSPEKRQQILALDPNRFAATLRRWADWALLPRFYCANLPDGDLKRLGTPAHISFGFDDLHCEHTARRLYRILPNAEFLDHRRHFSEEEIDEAAQSTSGNFAIYGSFFQNFLARVEAGTFAPGRP